MLSEQVSRRCAGVLSLQSRGRAGGGRARKEENGDTDIELIKRGRADVLGHLLWENHLLALISAVLAGRAPLTYYRSLGGEGDRNVLSPALWGERTETVSAGPCCLPALQGRMCPCPLQRLGVVNHPWHSLACRPITPAPALSPPCGVLSVCLSLSLLFLEGHQSYWVRAPPQTNITSS